MELPVTEIPREADAPRELRDLVHNCGPVAAWQVLRAHGRRPAANELLRAISFEPSVGTFMIGLALGLSALGLAVTFHTDPDPAPVPLERALYARARDAGLVIRPALSLVALHERLAQGATALVLYETAHGMPHITPLTGVWLDEFIAPNEGDTFGRIDLERGWARPGIHRQCVVVEGVAPVA